MRFSLPVLAAIFASLCSLVSAQGQGIGNSFASMGSLRTSGSWETSRFSAPSVTYAPRAPAAIHSRSIDARLLAAARIAEAKAHVRSQRLCWRYVKQALVKAGAVGYYPKSVYAKQAASELVSAHGFRRLRARSPYEAPIGSVLVYGGHGAGHVEIRTARGFVSDYRSKYACGLPFLGAYAKGS